MIFDRTGLVEHGLYINGFTWSPSYLVTSGTPVLFEAGFSCMAPLYERDIRSNLDRNTPGFLFLTHVHYDHCGAASHFKKVFPDLKVCGSRKAADILNRTNAVKLMRSLSESVVPLIVEQFNIDKSSLACEPFEPFPIDIAIETEQIITIDEDLTIQVMFTPGHTRDMLSFYIPQRKILIATESAGCLARNGRIISEFLVDFDSYMNTLERFRKLDVEVLCQGHHFVFTGDDVPEFLKGAIRSARFFKERVETLLTKENGDIDRVMDVIKSEEYDANASVKQPERAYQLNLRTRIEHLAARMKLPVV